MQVWDLASVGPVFIGSSITVISTVIGVMLPGFQIARAPFLLLSPAVLIVLSADRIVFSTSRSPHQL